MVDCLLIIVQMSDRSARVFRCFFCCVFFFFFQAEDGIRDFCLSRGLGVFGFISGVVATIRALKPVVEPIKRRARELVRRARSSA